MGTCRDRELVRGAFSQSPGCLPPLIDDTHGSKPYAQNVTQEIQGGEGGLGNHVNASPDSVPDPLYTLPGPRGCQPSGSHHLSCSLRHFFP